MPRRRQAYAPSTIPPTNDDAVKMFSAAIYEGGPATATRSRRRQRPVSSDNSIQQPKAKRQRIPLSEQTFINPDAAPEMFEVKPDRVARLQRDGVENGSVPAPKRELSVRSKKAKAGERLSKGDGSVVLVCCPKSFSFQPSFFLYIVCKIRLLTKASLLQTSNNAYTVSKLPALPDRIRADAASEYPFARP